MSDANELTPERIAELKAICDAATEGPWDAEAVRTEGQYGSGEDVRSGFDAYEIRAGNEVLFDSLNSTAASIREEYDEEDGGGCTWDEVAKKNLEFVATARTALPAALDALTAAHARIKELEGQLEQAKGKPVGEWRVWQIGFAQYADNGIGLIYARVSSGATWTRMKGSNTPEWYERNGYREITDPAKLAAIRATLPGEVRR